MDDFTWQMGLALMVALGQIVLLATTRVAPDLIMWGGVVLLTTLGVLSPREALSGLSNEGMVTVGVLYLVVTGLRDTGGVGFLVANLMGKARTATAAQIRMLPPVAALSAVMNNTPLVAMLIGPLNDWAKANRISPSKLMMPLSIATILGGTCSLIGTSTNLVVHGLMKDQKLEVFSLFDLAWVGVPVALIGLSYLLFTSRWFLPDRKPAISLLSDPREYTAEMVVQPGSPLVGKTIEDAGLRHLSGMFLVEIDRDGLVLPAVGPQERLRANDRLVFAGIVESMIDLQRIRGLEPATDQVFKLNAPRTERCLIEAVVSNSHPLVGRTIREGRFRNRYNAVVIAVARDGARIRKKIGDIILLPGDTLLLEAPANFVDDYRNDRDFFLVSRLENSTPPRHDRAWIALAILIGMITLATFNIVPMVLAAMLAGALMLLTRCCTGSAARASVDWTVLLVIAGSFGVSRAIETTHAAEWVASQLARVGDGNPWVALGVLYLVTLVFTELISNNAAAALMFPIALATSTRLGCDFKPFAIVLMMAASAGFATPIGYQTNLMVYGPGGYKFSDYLRLGIPLDLLIAAVTVAITPWIWPFHP